MVRYATGPGIQINVMFLLEFSNIRNLLFNFVEMSLWLKTFLGLSMALIMNQV